MLFQTRRRISLALAGAGLLVLATDWLSGTCSAEMILGPPTPLGELVDQDGEIIAGDKRFFNFEYTATGDMPLAEDVNVSPLEDDDGNLGLRFQGAFLDLASTPGGSDAFITYTVEVLNPNKLISDAHLKGNPNLLGDLGSVSVTETFLPLGPNGEYTMEIYDDESLPTPLLVDWVFFDPPVDRLNVQKDILAKAVFDEDDGNDNGQTATISFVDQTFSQVPEPTTALLTLMAAVVAVFCMRKQR